MLTVCALGIYIILSNLNDNIVFFYPPSELDKIKSNAEKVRVEGYVLAPKIIGDRIGLHPVWIIFSVFAAGSVFGFVGVIFAIPLAGIVKVFLSHIIDYYKSSNMYKN